MDAKCNHKIEIRHIFIVCLHGCPLPVYHSDDSASEGFLRRSKCDCLTEEVRDVREMKVFTRKCKPDKLFAKHIKLDE
ncbi:unnamed protein product [Sphagnum balticum]